MAKYCEGCGAEVSNEQIYCPYCGKQQKPSNIKKESSLVSKSSYSSSSSKSKIVAGLLGIFLGGWGLHSFYLGNITKGIIQIIVTLLTCGFGAIWGFIEGILILVGTISTDADGNPLGE